MKKILAIDYGTKRVGLAISRVGLAEPLKILTNDEHLLAKINQVINQEGIELVLVGISENKMAAKTSQFVQKLKQQVSISVELVDETLSSNEVHTKLISAHMKLKKRQGPIDHYAAAVVLQEWLDTYQ